MIEQLFTPHKNKEKFIEYDLQKIRNLFYDFFR